MGRTIDTREGAQTPGASFPDVDEAHDAPLTGARLGAWVVSRELGRGGTAVVYEARHVELGHAVALKRLLPAAAHDATLRRRFLREARILARVRHPHLVEVHDAGADSRGLWLAMDLLDGETLASRLAHLGPMPPSAAAGVGMAVLAALARVHAEGVVHRDVKPANLWLRLPLQGGEGFDAAKHRDPARTPPLSTVVIDFRMVRAMRVSQEAVGRFVAGTPGYIAPEQVLDPMELDGRADVYALAGTVYNVLAGRPFFDEVSSMRDRILAHMQRDPFEDADRVRAFPGALTKLLREGTARNPADRPQPLEFGREFAKLFT